MSRFGPVVLLLGSLAAAASATKAVAPRPASSFAAGAGLGWGTMSVGDASASRFTPSLNLRFGRERGFALAAELQPLAIPNPYRGESYLPVNLLLGWSFGEKFRVRPVAGAQLRWWSGPNPVESFDSGPVVGVDVGPVFRLARGRTLAIEAVWRASIVEIEGSVGSRYLGVQTALARPR